jgi:predicted negative regulator of RcsB-dependent stress response
MLDLEEQEKIDILKAWWKQYASWVWAFVLVLALSYASVQGWRYYQRGQAEKAGVLFDAVRNAARGGDAVATLQAAKALQEAQSGSPLATRGALMAAAVSHVKGDGAGARAELEWVIAHSNEAPMVDLARIRAAGLLADEQKFDEALKLLEANHDPAFVALTADRRGDILTAQGKTSEARAAYQIAMDRAPATGVLKQLDASKRDALGDTK